MCSTSVKAVRSGKDSLQSFTKPVLKNTPLLHKVLFILWTLYSVLGLKIHMYCFEINNLFKIKWLNLSSDWSLLMATRQHGDMATKNLRNGHSSALNSATVSGRIKNPITNVCILLSQWVSDWVSRFSAELHVIGLRPVGHPKTMIFEILACFVHLILYWALFI